MSSLAYKQKVKHTDFEDKIVREFGLKDLSTRIHYEDDYKLSLYYFHGKHIATWHKGEGWVFSHAYKEVR